MQDNNRNMYDVYVVFFNKKSVYLDRFVLPFLRQRELNT